MASLTPQNDRHSPNLMLFATDVLPSIEHDEPLSHSSDHLAELDIPATEKILEELYHTLDWIEHTSKENGKRECEQVAASKIEDVKSLNQELQRTRAMKGTRALNFAKEVFSIILRMEKHVPKNELYSNDLSELEDSKKKIVREIMKLQEALEQHERRSSSPQGHFPEPQNQARMELGKMAGRIGRRYYGMEWARGAQ